MTVFIAICVIAVVTLVVVALSGGARERDDDETQLPELKPTLTPLPGRYPATRARLQNPALLGWAKGVEKARP